MAKVPILMKYEPATVGASREPEVFDESSFFIRRRPGNRRTDPTRAVAATRFIPDVAGPYVPRARAVAATRAVRRPFRRTYDIPMNER